MSGGLGAEAVQRRTLLVVLVLNAALFVGLGVGGLLADSSGFLAVGRAMIWKTRAAWLSGIMLLIFAAGVLADVARRWIVGTEPVGWTMMGLAVVAAVVNLICLMLIRRQDSDDVNMRAAETFSFNDFASNGGILVAGGLVMALNQAWPDLLVGLIVAAIALKGGLDILKDARGVANKGQAQ
ncbi:MAG: RND transporter [Brevundimonas diminuta]|nr:MAG: RND transporter [Brevundimonas diminuta]